MFWIPRQHHFVRVGYVLPGDVVWIFKGEKNGFELTNVTRVEMHQTNGLINPFTMAGNIVVDGVAVSVYNDLMGSEERMHSFVSFIRYMYKTSPSLMKTVHSSGLHHHCSRLLIYILNEANGQSVWSYVMKTAVSITSSLFST